MLCCYRIMFLRWQFLYFLMGGNLAFNVNRFLWFKYWAFLLSLTQQLVLNFIFRVINFVNCLLIDWFSFFNLTLLAFIHSWPKLVLFILVFFLIWFGFLIYYLLLVLWELHLCDTCLIIRNISLVFTYHLFFVFIILLIINYSWLSHLRLEAT